ncbi:MAG: hypothetical protein IJ083_02580 [Clostridia bacterium]|nr:hypothetical protein [Clostridia bacterium]
MSGKKTVQIFCRGSQAEHVGSWACILDFQGHRKELSGHMAEGTGERMLLMAVISGIGALKEPCHVILQVEKEEERERLSGGIRQPAMQKENQDLWMILRIQGRKHDLEVACTRDADTLSQLQALLGAAEGEYLDINRPRDEDALIQEFTDGKQTD